MTTIDFELYEDGDPYVTFAMDHKEDIIRFADKRWAENPSAWESWNHCVMAAEKHLWIHGLESANQ